MTQPTPLDVQTALINVMVLSAVADGDMSDQELLIIGDMVDKLPVFEGFDRALLDSLAEHCVARLTDESALDTILAEAAGTLPHKFYDTAYAVACEVVACDTHASQEELRFLEMIRDQFTMDRLTAAAIERGVAAFNRTF